MVKQRIYPNYTDNYYYEKGDSYLVLHRTRSVYGGTPIYKNTIYFDTPQEAEEYFENIE